MLLARGVLSSSLPARGRAAPQTQLGRRVVLVRGARCQLKVVGRVRVVAVLGKQLGKLGGRAANRSSSAHAGRGGGRGRLGEVATESGERRSQRVASLLDVASSGLDPGDEPVRLRGMQTRVPPGSLGDVCGAREQLRELGEARLGACEQRSVLGRLLAGL